MENSIIFTVRLAEQLYKVDCKAESTKKFLKDYIVPDEEKTGDGAVCLEVRKEDIDSERVKVEEEQLRAGETKTVYSDAYLETLALYRKIAEDGIGRGIILFHGSCIAVDGEAYLFTAPSGTGKSTHTRLWRQLLGERAVMVNDDKPLIRITDEGATAYGTPWNGKHRLSANTGVRLKAICLLERSIGNHIDRTAYTDIFPALFQQTYRPSDPEGMRKTLELLDRLGQTVKFYRLGCNMDISAAELSYNTMRGTGGGSGETAE